MIYGYVGVRIIPPAGLGTGFSVFLWVMLLVLMFLPHTAIFMRGNGVRNVLATLIARAAYLSLGFITILFPLLVVRDAGMGALALGRKLTGLTVRASGSAVNPDSRPDPVRRRISLNMLNMGLLAATGGLSAYGLYEARRSPRVKEVTIPVRGLPESLGKLRIVQITDIHVSVTVRRSFVEGVVETVNGISPDMIVLTGDLADGSVDELGGEIAPLAQLSAPMGKYFVTGNHEYYTGVKGWLGEVRRLGFIPLINEHRIVEVDGARLLVAGVTDYNAGMMEPRHKSSPASALEGAPPADMKLLLAHQPRSVFEAARVGFDVQLSGHTHGGQYIPWNYFVRLQQPYTSGLVRHDGTMLYISRGTGYWGPPFRIGQPSEITLITFTRA